MTDEPREKCAAAVALGRMGKGKPKHYKPDDLARLSKRMTDMNRERFRKINEARDRIGKEPVA